MAKYDVRVRYASRVPTRSLRKTATRRKEL